MKPMTPQEVSDAQKADAKVYVLDCRKADAYIHSHIPGSVVVPQDSSFAIWTAYLVDPTKGEKIILVAEPGKEKDAITRLSRTGLDSCIGYLEGGFDSWTNAGMPTESTDIVRYSSSSDFETAVKGSRIIDVRNRGEWENGVLEDAEL